MTDNPNPGTPGNPDPNVPPAAPPAPPPPAAPAAATWKSGLTTDLKGAPFLQKFEDTPEGLNKAMESYGNLEKLLGHEKVPIPKGPDDAEGWNRFSKALGIPDKAEGYGLADFNPPEGAPNLSIDKNRFAEIVHAHKLTPAQAKGLWEAYNELNYESYNQVIEQSQKKINETINSLKGKWGDTYDLNVELGQMVINKFSNDQDMNDYITAVLTQDPRGIEFLAKIGNQFAENKVGEFKIKRFSLAPEEIQNEIDKMTMDLEGPYMNTKNQHTEAEHQRAVDRMNELRRMLSKAQGQA